MSARRVCVTRPLVLCVQDVAYVFSGYAPLSVRLIEAALSAQGWHGLDDALKLLPGPTFETRQALPAGVADTRGKATGTSRHNISVIARLFSSRFFITIHCHCAHRLDDGRVHWRCDTS